MKKKYNIIKNYAYLLMVTIGMLAGCQPEDSNVDNGLSDPNIKAAFTITPIAGESNLYEMKATTTEGVLAMEWDKGDGGGFSAAGNPTEVVFYPDAGVYTIQFKAIGRGGVTAVATQDINVAVSDPNAGNIVVGGKMETDEDDSKWTRLVADNAVMFKRENGKMVASGGSWGHQGVYQALEIQGGKTYKIDMLVSGKGATDTWFEVYVGQSAPTVIDYNDGGKRLQLNTWAGCGNAQFSNKLSMLSCGGEPTLGGQFTFPESGTVYLVIRSGGANLGDGGISFDNVEVRAID